MGERWHDRVNLAVADGVARLTLAHPAGGNALDLAMTRGLRDAVASLASYDGLRAVRIDAEGRVFCVGGDLHEFAAAADATARVTEVAAAAHDALAGLRALPVPVVSVVQGVVAGGGIGFALVADVVLMARSAKLRVAYTAAGLSPDCGVSLALARALGPARAMDLALTNRTLSGDEAAQWGLVSRAVDDDALQEVADGLVQQLADGPQQALAATRRLLRDAARVDSEGAWRAHLDAEAVSIARLAGTTDGREGVAAFLGKRPPRFGA